MKPGGTPSFDVCARGFIFYKQVYYVSMTEMNPEPPHRAEWPHIEVLPLLDKVVSAGLWLGRLVTRQYGHNPPTHGDHLPDAQLLPFPDHAGELPDADA